MSATYAVRSGALRHTVTLPQRATCARDVAELALRAAANDPEPIVLGVLVCVSGEQFAGDATQYLHTETLLRGLGIGCGEPSGGAA